MKLAAVIPAAGSSRRMGREKMLLPFGRSTVLETVLDTLRTVGVEERIVVVRPDLSEAVERIRRTGARAVFNPHPESPMLVSIQLGLAALPADAEAFFVWPADHPAVRAETVERLARAADPGRILIPVYAGRRGHPALVGVKFLPEIASLPPEQMLRYLWRLKAEAVHEVSVEDPGILQDLNTPEDYQGTTRQ